MPMVGFRFVVFITFSSSWPQKNHLRKPQTQISIMWSSFLLFLYFFFVIDERIKSRKKISLSTNQSSRSVTMHSIISNNKKRKQCRNIFQLLSEFLHFFAFWADVICTILAPIDDDRKLYIIFPNEWRIRNKAKRSSKNYKINEVDAREKKS